MKDVPPKMIVVVGETASGKSAMGMALAQQYNGEIISADSWAIYREMNIGTAKPTLAEQGLVRHHLIDVIQPDEDYTAAVYKQQALDAIDDISSRGKLPIMVGGTGLYVDSVLFDYSFADEGDPELREKYNALPIDEVLAEVERQDISVVGIDVRNKRRLIRLLETGGAVPTRKPMRENTLVLGIASSKNKLRERVQIRVERMCADGLKYEAKAIGEKYGWDAEAMKGIGYAEWVDYFTLDESSPDRPSLQEVKRRIVRNTMALAKRQRTWFKRHSEIVWIDNDGAAVVVDSFLG